MKRALCMMAVALAACSSSNPPVQTAPAGQTSSVVWRPERAVRRDIPITNMIRRAYKLGTRDSTGRPGRNYWQTRADYNIDARLDVPTSTITGRETITLYNNSDSVMRNVYLRLDQNIFTANAARGTTVPEITEGTRITRMTLNGAAVDVNSPAARGQSFCQAPQGQQMTAPLACSLNTTLGLIRLAQPIAAKTTATLEIDWNFRVPKVDAGRGLRMGRMADSVYQVAQWYPRVAEFDDYRGWDTEPYLGNSEFNNNFGRFEVRYDVPAGWLVGSTGVLQNPEQVLSATARQRLARALDADTVVHVVTETERGAGTGTAGGDRLIWRFVADSVADVAFATSRTYVWDVTRATIPGKGAIPLHMFFPPSQQAQYTQVAERTRHALEFYSQLWMPYAFPQFTVSWGPELGMEYPMFIMSGLGAADHEAGHEWWPMMVGVNETWWGFMDEGFNQYMNILSDNHRTKRAPTARLDSLGLQYGRQIWGLETEAPLIWNENNAGPMYSFAAYGKAPMMLSALGGVVGDSAVWKAMSAYAHAWRFKKPTPWDFAFFMNNALKQDLGWFWYYWIWSNESVDGSIQNVVVNGTSATITVRQDGQMPSPVILQVQLAAAGPAVKNVANAVMTNATTAILTYPVDVWFNGSRTFVTTVDFGRAIEKITLDPGGRFPDRDVTDNAWPK
ncbi:MAG TPA: M1 family metallopeptidase [Longimicrobiales bacterium]|nr:M1 family metallopeptidase [Longimicrobiales bacterium]